MGNARRGVRSLTSVSLFSGCGGLDLGLRRAGFDVTFATDSSPICEESFTKNFPGVPFFCGPVSKLTRKTLSDLSGWEPGQPVDLLAGGPPCPSFSKSRFYRTEKPRALGDANGSETITGFLRVLGWMRPRAFLLENVPGMAYKVHREALDMVIRRSTRLGYRCAWSIVNAADYGIPQTRERFILVGMQGTSFVFPAQTHAGVAETDGKKPWVTAGDAIGDLDTRRNASDEGHFAGGRHHDLLRKIPPGQNYLFFTPERGHPRPVFKWRSRYWSFLLKLSRELPSWTIQARRSNNMGPFHWRNRILRVAEVRRLQTIPDDWHLAGRIEDQWRQIGNAVPPLLAEHLGKAVATQLRLS